MSSDITVWRYQIRNTLRATQANSLLLTLGAVLILLVLLAVLCFWVGRNIATNSGHLVFGGVTLLLYIWFYLTSFLRLGQRAAQESLPIPPRTLIWYQIIKLQLAGTLLTSATVFAFYAGRLDFTLFTSGQVSVLWLIIVLTTLSLANLGLIAAILVRLIARNSLTRILLALALAIIFYQVIPGGDYPLTAVIDGTLTRVVADELITLLLASVGLLGLAMSFVEFVINRLPKKVAVNQKFQYWNSLTYHRNLGSVYNLGEASLIVELLRLARDTRTHWRLVLIITLTSTSLLLIGLLPVETTATKLLVTTIGTSLVGITIGLSSGEAFLVRRALLADPLRWRILPFSLTAGLIVSAALAVVIFYLFFESRILLTGLFLIIIASFFHVLSFQLSLANLADVLRIFVLVATSALMALIIVVFVREIGWREAYGVLLLWATAILLGALYLRQKRPRNYQFQPV